MENTSEEELVKTLKQREEELIPKYITTEDMIASINYLLNMYHGYGKADDIDHLANRRISLIDDVIGFVFINDCGVITSKS